MASDPEETGPLPPDLRFLKTLVTVLTAVMILGLLTMVGIFVIRLGPSTPAAIAPPLPEEITLPDGVRAISVTWGPDFYAVVTDDRRVLVFGADGKLVKSVEIE